MPSRVTTSSSSSRFTARPLGASLNLGQVAPCLVDHQLRWMRQGQPISDHLSPPKSWERRPNGLVQWCGKTGGGAQLLGLPRKMRNDDSLKPLLVGGQPCNWQPSPWGKPYEHKEGDGAGRDARFWGREGERKKKQSKIAKRKNLMVTTIYKWRKYFFWRNYVITITVNFNCIFNLIFQVCDFGLIFNVKPPPTSGESKIINLKKA